MKLCGATARRSATIVARRRITIKQRSRTRWQNINRSLSTKTINNSISSSNSSSNNKKSNKLKLMTNNNFNNNQVYINRKEALLH